MREAVARGGTYEPLFELATGGMATVLVARHAGAVGFERLVVIKRVHPHLCREAEFCAMFVDEARIASAIHHPNVVSVIDVAHQDGQLLLVLDYVQGLSLAELVKLASEAGVPVPPAVTSRILADTLSGLAAAHDATDLAGCPLHVVHRDVSPQNILVGADGVSRVIDFGIAKATARLTSTTSGVVKGKLSYMAPEQIKMQPLDSRADVFSAGVVLHELLTGARLFQAGVDGDAVLKVLLGEIPAPSRLAPGLPAAVDELVLRALARRPEDRVQSAAELRDALEAACPPAPARDVAALVERLGNETLTKQRTALEAALRRDPAGAPAREQGDDGHALPTRVDRPQVARGRSRAKTLVVPVSVVAAAAAALAAVAYFGWPFARRSGAATPSPSSAEASASTPRAGTEPVLPAGPDGTAAPSTAPSASAASLPAPVYRVPAGSAAALRRPAVAAPAGLKKNPYGGP